MINRRNFIAQTSSAIAGSMLVPAFANAKEQKGLILGHGPKKYSIDLEWGNLDASKYPVKDCHEMVQDKKGRIFLLTNHIRNNILIYNRKGKLMDSWGKEYPGGHGLTLCDENGTEMLFLTDTERHQVIKTTLDGKVLLTIDYPKESGLYQKADEFVPTETTIAPNGDIFIADGYGKDYILVYDSAGKFKYYFGGKGTEAKNLKNAHGITVDYRNPMQPTLIVTSREQNCFKRFSLGGEYLSTIEMPGAWVCRPVIKGDYLYAAVLQSNNKPWKESGFITILDKNDKVISNPGGNLPEMNNGVPGEMYQTESVFKYPHDVCVDDDGNIYLAQWNSGHVYPFKLKPHN